MFEIEQRQRQTLIVKVKQKHLSVGLFCAFESFLNAQLSQGCLIVCFDFSNAKSIDFSATAELLEIYRAYNAIIDIAFCALPVHPAFSESSCSLSQFLPLYSSVDEAIMSDDFSVAQLRSLNAIVLAGDSPQNILPSFPPTLLPIMGSSLLKHNLQHLETAGVRKVTVDTGQFGTTIRQHLYAEDQAPCFQMGFFNSPLSASMSDTEQPMHRLSKLQNMLSIFRQDTIVMLGNALPNAEILSFYHEHQRSAADITLLVSPSQKLNEKVNSTLQDSVTCIIIGGGALDGPPLPNIGQSYSELRAFFTLRGQKVHTVYAATENRIVISLRTYVRVLSHALAGNYPQLRLQGFTSQADQWRHQDADISSDLKVQGACYIGPGVKIASGVQIVGPTSIESGCEIGRGARVEHSVLSDAHHTPAHALRRDVFAAMDRVVPLHQLSETTPNPSSRHVLPPSTPCVRAS